MGRFFKSFLVLVAIALLLTVVGCSTLPFAPDEYGQLEIEPMDSETSKVEVPWIPPFAEGNLLEGRVNRRPGADGDWEAAVVVSFFDQNGGKISEQEQILERRSTSGCPVHRFEHGTHMRREYALYRVSLPENAGEIARVEVRAKG